MYTIGYDIGSSSVKIALVEQKSGKKIDVIQEPKDEMGMISIKPSWAEQSIIRSKAADKRTGNEITPIIAVTKKAQIVRGSLVIDIPLVLRLITVTM